MRQDKDNTLILFAFGDQGPCPWTPPGLAVLAAGGNNSNSGTTGQFTNRKATGRDGKYSDEI